MKINLNNLCDNLIYVVTIILIASITLFTTFTWGRYVLLLCLTSIIGISVLKNNGKYRVYVGKYIIFILMFAIFTIMSGLWALHPEDSFSQGKTLLEISIMGFVLYNYYIEDDKGIKNLLSAIKISSFIIVIYSIVFYGIDNLLIMATIEERMQNTYANVNTIGMLAAIGTLIQLDELIETKKISVGVLLCIPSILIIALTQSRKAFIMLIGGLILILWMKNIYSKNIIKTAVKAIVYSILGVLIIYYLQQFPIFSGVIERLEGLWNSFLGTGSVDNSVLVRNQMISIGWKQFLETPIGGMGMGNPHHLSLEVLGRDAYLHNNFIELLAGGGIIGFVLYYIMYFYLFINFWRYKECRNNEYVICFVIMFIMLIMDYGRVSYYAKNQYIYFMLYFLEVESLKLNAYKKG